MPRAPILLLGLSCVVTLVAVLSCWPLGWISDDWFLLARAQDGALLLEPRHASLPRRLMWAAAAAGAGPWLFRGVALTAHLITALVLLPRTARLLFPEWDRWTPLQAGLTLLCLASVLEPLMWPAASAYALLGLTLQLTALGHLRWLEQGGPRWRAVSWVGAGLSLATWELGVVTPVLVAVLSWAKRRSPRAVGWDVLPHAILVMVYLGAKLILGSTETVAYRGLVRMAGNVVAWPLLQLSPWPLEHQLLGSPVGICLAIGVLLLVLGLAWRLSDRRAVGLLLLAFATALPVLPGPGPSSRVLLLTAPWMVLFAWAAWEQGRVRLGPRGRGVALGVLGVWCAANAVTAWRAGQGYREADGEARRVVQDVVAQAESQGASRVVVVDAPDRLPGWGPVWRFYVWRHGLRAALDEEGIELVAQAHSEPVDIERQGRIPSHPPLTNEAQVEWRRKGLPVLLTGEGRDE